MDGGRDRDIFDINEGMQKGGKASCFLAEVSRLINLFPLYLVSIEAGLNLVEGDIVLDGVCPFNSCPFVQQNFLE